MQRITKPELIRLIRSMPDDEVKRAFIAELIRAGSLSENDLAEFAVHEVEQNLDRFVAAIKDDDRLRFYWERFRDYPQYLARALARIRPDLFYTYGLAFRLVLKLRADLGPVVIPPFRPGGEDRGVVPMPELPREVREDLVSLDLECRFREMLYFFSTNLAEGRALLRMAIDEAKTPYDREVLEAVGTRVEALLGMEFPGVVPTLHGRPFPALHVRWWIDQVKDVARCLNIGDTGTYKTSFAALAVRYYGSRRVLVICAPHARENWAREIASYFTTPPRVVVVQSSRDLGRIADAEFVIVGYSTLISRGVPEALLAQGFDALIMDESQYGKGVEGLNGQAARRAIACQRLIRELPLERFIALSATPWENRPEELAAIAVALRPDLFPGGPLQFIQSGAGQSPRFLRELFADQVLEAELREIRDLPQINPKPWEDLFGAVPIPMGDRHREIYEFVRDDEPGDENDDEGLTPMQKVGRLLQAAIHPHLVEPHFDWPARLRGAFRDWRTSSKLVWLKRFVEERIADSKVVVGTGLYAEGVTRLTGSDLETAFIGRLFKEWFGEERVLIIDGTLRARAPRGRLSPRDEAIVRWRTDPNVRVLLVSMQACPDSVNLTVAKQPGVAKLWVTALSFGWRPWKQFLGRFVREGQGVPIEYQVPIVEGTIDEDLLRLNEEKWRAQTLFRAQAPLTDREWQMLRQGGIRQLARLVRTSSDHVAHITSMMRGRGEEGCLKAYRATDGTKTTAELFAEHFLAVQEYAGSGHISRFMSKVMDELVANGLVDEAKCFDAGCGPCTMARRRGAPWYGVDMNPEMIAVARSITPHLTVNTREGFLSELPADWTGRFDLTVSSLVLHFSSLKPVRHTEAERLRILRELVRVTNPHGLLWLAWNRAYQTRETFLAWMEGFRAEGFAVHRELSGLVRATDGGKRPFMFWSLVVSPNGKVPTFRNGANPFRFPFEFAHRKVVRKREEDRDDLPPVDRRQRRQFSQFEVVDVRTRVALRDTEAARRVVRHEIERWCTVVDAGGKIRRVLSLVPREFESDWRTLDRLRKHGVLPV